MRCADGKNSVTGESSAATCGIMRPVRMLPSQLDPATPSKAEKGLFNKLRPLDDPHWYYALHSLNLSDHARKRVAEVDFLLLGPHGVFVLEVKGGRVARSNGVWTFTDRYGNTRRKREGPFVQAGTAMFALEKRLRDLLGGDLVDRTTFGYGVVLPDMVFDTRSVEWSEEMVLDQAQLGRQDGLLRSLNRMAAYWRNKPGKKGAELTKNEIAEYLRVLRPDFDAIPKLKSVADAAENEFARLTESQFVALDKHQRNVRLIYEGGAGTGKTMLAAELARRHSRSGDKVLFTCHSPVIAAFVAAQRGLEDVDVIPLDRLKPAKEPVYDVIIVDEAQDVINDTNISILEGLLKNGFHDGHWNMFLDSNNQTGLVGSYDPDAMEYIRLARPAEVALTDNCRNTTTIAETVTQVTGADVGVSTAGTGPAVQFIYAADTGDAARLVKAELDRLEEEGVSAEEITLLSTVDFLDSTYAQLPAHWRHRVASLDSTRWGKRPQSQLGFARIQDFKGLETPFAIVTDVDDVENQRSAMYVGMTRARVGLCVILPQVNRRAIEKAEKAGLLHG